MNETVRSHLSELILLRLDRGALNFIRRGNCVLGLSPRTPALNQRLSLSASVSQRLSLSASVSQCLSVSVSSVFPPEHLR